MQIVLYDLGKKEIGKYSDKEQPMWKAVETEKLKFQLRNGEKNSFIQRRWHREGSKIKEVRKIENTIAHDYYKSRDAKSPVPWVYN